MLGASGPERSSGSGAEPEGGSVLLLRAQARAREGRLDAEVALVTHQLDPVADETVGSISGPAAEGELNASLEAAAAELRERKKRPGPVA